MDKKKFGSLLLAKKKIGILKKNYFQNFITVIRKGGFQFLWIMVLQGAVANGVHLAVVGDVHKLFTCNNEHMIIESFVESASIDSPTILALIYPNAGFPILPDRCSYPFKVMKVTDLEYSMKSCRSFKDVITKPFIILK